MSNLLLWTGRLAGGVGAAVFVVALGARLTQTWTVGGTQISTLLQVATAAMVMACLAYCADIAERARR